MIIGVTTGRGDVMMKRATAAFVAVAGVAVVVAMSVGVGTATGNFKGINGLIAFDSWTGTNSQDIGVFDPNSAGTPTFLTWTPDSNEQTPRWSRDGKRIVYMSRLEPLADPAPPYDIWVMNADGTNPVNVTNTPDRDEQVPAWTADGRIVFAGGSETDPENWDIYVINADGSGRENVTNTPASAFEVWPSPAPNGNKLAFSRFTDATGVEIWTVNLNGTGQRKVTVGRQSDWSPSGNDLVFTRPSTGTDRDVWTANTNGTGLRRLTDTPTRREVFPSWAPDGASVVYGGVVDPGVINIFALDLTTNTERLLLAASPPTTYSVAYPSWQPLGRP